MSLVTKGQLLSLQYLRAVAAIMVVLHHARNPQPWLFNPMEHFQSFAWGVDIFFLISGFIMYVAARHESLSDFLVRRLIRVVPLYWVATLAFVLVSTKLQPWTISADDGARIIKSMLFIPHSNPRENGEIFPYLIPGWTLNYEMFFYAIFFVGLLVGRLAWVVSLVMMALLLVGGALNPGDVILRAYTRPYISEFLCGFWVGWLYVRYPIRCGWSVCLYLGALGLIFVQYAVRPEYRFAARALLATMILVGALAHDQWLRQSKFLRDIGDASYSIYLSHGVFSLPLAKLIWRHVPIEGWGQFIGWLVLCLVISSYLGVLLYKHFEKPVLAWSKAKWEARKAARTLAGC